MGNSTKITWTDKTWNPWRGCHKISAGCKNCYMFREQERYGNDPNVVVQSKTTFLDPLKWKEPARVFTCSWSDFFIKEADPWRDEAWKVIKQTSHLTYQVLTKRIDQVMGRLPDNWNGGYTNVWLGTTVEDRSTLWRKEHLTMIAARTHFLSVEPLLELIDLGSLQDIDWVIVGGESGTNFRKMDLDWARSIRDQCKVAGVAFFYKQTSGLRPGTEPLLDGVEYHEFPRIIVNAPSV